MPIPFDSHEYWRQRFEHEDTFEWLMPWHVLENHLQRLALLSPSESRPTQQVLNLGCGNSTLPLDLYEAGYRHVLSVDFVKEVVDRMREKCEAAIGWKDAQSSRDVGDSSTMAEDGHLVSQGLLDQDACYRAYTTEENKGDAPIGERCDIVKPASKATATLLSRSPEAFYKQRQKSMSAPSPGKASKGEDTIHTNGTHPTDVCHAATFLVSTTATTPQPMTEMTQQKQEQKQEHQCPLEFREMDCLDLSSLTPDTFDFVLDKSTSDAIACGDDAESTKLRTLCEQVARVTKSNGVWCVVSYSQYRQYEFHDGAKGSGLWTTERIVPIEVKQQQQHGQHKKGQEGGNNKNKNVTPAINVVYQPEVYQYLYVNRRTMSDVSIKKA